MTIIVEDGTGVQGANSYTSVADAQAYATGRGLTLPEAEEDVAPLLIKGFEFIESKRAEFKGTKTYGYGYAQFPRTDLDIDGEYLEATQVPTEAIHAQIRVAVEIHAGIDVTPTVTENVKREKVGPLETEFFPGGLSGPILTAVDALLAPLLKQGGSFTLRTFRA